MHLIFSSRGHIHPLRSCLTSQASIFRPQATIMKCHLCFNKLLAQYASLGCATPEPACLCQNVNFGYGIRDCSNGACGTAVASTVIAFEKRILCICNCGFLPPNSVLENKLNQFPLHFIYLTTFIRILSCLKLEIS